MLGIIKTNTGSLTSGLYVVAAVEVCATVLILLFVPRTQRQLIQAAAVAH
jgi:hypothetical protein